MGYTYRVEMMTYLDDGLEDVNGFLQRKGYDVEVRERFNEVFPIEELDVDKRIADDDLQIILKHRFRISVVDN